MHAYTLRAQCQCQCLTPVAARTANADVLELRLLFPYYGGGTLAEALERHPAGLAEAVARSPSNGSNPHAKLPARTLTPQR